MHGSWQGGWPDRAQRAGTPWVRSRLLHTSGILADRYLLPQPSGYSSEMQVEEVLILQSKPEARRAAAEPGRPVWAPSTTSPHLLSPTRWTETEKAGCPVGEIFVPQCATSIRLDPVPWLGVLGRPLPPTSHPGSWAREREHGVGEQRPRGLSPWEHI